MKLVVTCGDPNGIGIEVMIKALAEFQEFDFDGVEIDIAGNMDTIKEYIPKIKHLQLSSYAGTSNLVVERSKYRVIGDIPYCPVELGAESAKAGAQAAVAIEYAVAATLEGQYDGLVTMPVSKSVLYKAGWQYPGHTEMLAARCGVDRPMMILCTDTVRVALATIHIPITKVPEELDTNRISERLRTLNRSLKYDYGINQPKIALLGLNPHAGEDGALGREEEEIISPAIENVRKDGIDAQGPFPSDGFFAHGMYKIYDGILAMYHDQGLIPLKLLAAGAGVNVTAGLPIVRTSPDHGTAFKIAGLGIADFESSTNALKMAVDIVRNRRKYSVV